MALFSIYTKFTDSIKELKAKTKIINKKVQGELALKQAIEALSDSDRVMAERIHAIVTETAPELRPMTWYGMPAYANEEGKIICYFQGADKFFSKCASFGINDTFIQEYVNMWPTVFALSKLTVSEEIIIKELIRKTVG